MIKELIDSKEKVLIGIGEDFGKKSTREDMEYGIAALIRHISNKDYYIISLQDITFPNDDRVYYPLKGENGMDDYNKWLGYTLNRELLIIELGVGLTYPHIIRFPFERIAFINYKAQMIRIHQSLYQTTEELGEKCTSIKGEPISILIEELGEL